MSTRGRNRRLAPPRPNLPIGNFRTFGAYRNYRANSNRPLNARQRSRALLYFRNDTRITNGNFRRGSVPPQDPNPNSRFSIMRNAATLNKKSSAITNSNNIRNQIGINGMSPTTLSFAEAVTCPFSNQCNGALRPDGRGINSIAANDNLKFVFKPYPYIGLTIHNTGVVTPPTVSAVTGVLVTFMPRCYAAGWTSQVAMSESIRVPNTAGQNVDVSYTTYTPATNYVPISSTFDEQTSLDPMANAYTLGISVIVIDSDGVTRMVAAKGSPVSPGESIIIEQKLKVSEDKSQFLTQETADVYLQTNNVNKSLETISLIQSNLAKAKNYKIAEFNKKLNINQSKKVPLNEDNDIYSIAKAISVENENDINEEDDDDKEEHKDIDISTEQKLHFKSYKEFQDYTRNEFQKIQHQAKLLADPDKIFLGAFKIHRPRNTQVVGTLQSCRDRSINIVSYTRSQSLNGNVSGLRIVGAGIKIWSNLSPLNTGGSVVGGYITPTSLAAFFQLSNHASQTTAAPSVLDSQFNFRKAYYAVDGVTVRYNSCSSSKQALFQQATLYNQSLLAENTSEKFHAIINGGMSGNDLMTTGDHYPVVIWRFDKPIVLADTTATSTLTIESVVRLECSPGSTNPFVAVKNKRVSCYPLINDALGNVSIFPVVSEGHSFMSFLRKTGEFFGHIAKFVSGTNRFVSGVNNVVRTFLPAVEGG